MYNEFWWCIDVVWETLYRQGMIVDRLCVCLIAKGEVLGFWWAVYAISVSSGE